MILIIFMGFIIGWATYIIIKNDRWNHDKPGDVVIIAEPDFTHGLLVMRYEFNPYWHHSPFAHGWWMVGEPEKTEIINENGGADFIKSHLS